MKTKKVPRALSEKFGEKLSQWLQEILFEITDTEDFKETTFEIIEFSHKEGCCFGKEENQFIGKMFSKMLSLAFILEKNQEEIESFYEDYKQ